MLSKIRIYGKLAKFLKRRVFHAEVSSAAEAVRFLVTNFPQLEAHMSQHHYKVTVGSYDITLDELHHPVGQQEIKIVPMLSGAGAAGRIIAGVALVAAAIAIPGLGLGLAGATVTQVGLIGGALILGGISQLLTPTPQAPSGPDSEKDPRKSYSFSGIQQTSRQGVPVPVVYGETIVGSVVISAGIDTVQVV
jgi:predicted phage tail protein